MTGERTLEQTVRWLADRAQISDLLHSFARALDTRDWQAYADNYTDDGVLELPPRSGAGRIVLHRADMPERVPKSLAAYSGTWHLSTNHQIEVDGDTARSRSYLLATHVRESLPDHWQAGGWYDNTYRRTAKGWKFAHVRLTAVWLAGTQAPPITFD